jgi:citrate/tricarballylate utilization protein
MELRRNFLEQDLNYLANLCHNCRDCYYACQYVPPHEFALNVPKTLAELRLETYEKFCWPHFLGKLFRQNGLAMFLITLLCVAFVLSLTLIFQGPEIVFSVHTGENAFYKVISYNFIVLPVSALTILLLASLMIEAYRFWCETGGTLYDLCDSRVHIRAIRDVLRLRYLDGGGPGCNYPDERFRSTRKWLHHLVFYGFMLCFASTIIAAVYENLLHWGAPYPFLSWPVLLGTCGGIGLLAGTAGLLYLKLRMDPIPATPRSFGMDVAFLVLLFLTSLTGMVLLILRETPAMGILLAVHLGFVIALFITMPYGKFTHAIYRYAALVRNVIEQSRGEL